MDLFTKISVITLLSGFLAWFISRLGVALEIPFFIKVSERIAEKRRIREQRCSISFDASSIAVVDLSKPEGNVFSLRWTDIERITVFKRDIFTVDLICLCADFAGDKGLELDEDMPGWNALIDVLPKQLPGCKRREDWFSTVAYPPFAPNPTEIYRRESAQSK